MPSPPRWAKVLIGAAALAVAAAAIWLLARPSPWREGFSSCTYGGYVSAWCATIAVPADPRRPGGATLDLHVAVLPATEHPAAGALFYLEGGPGGAATAAAVEVNQLFAEVARTRDIVMIDQRGMGGSAPLACSGRTVRADDAAAVVAYLRGCFAHLPGDARLDSTAAAAADVEAVRRRLRYGRIDLYGGSYGATLAQAYLGRYPRSVRSVVLDSGSLPAVRIYDRSARNAQHALDRLLARCAGAAECHRAYPHTRAELAALLRRAPVKITVPQGTYVLRPADIAWAVDALAQSVSGAISIPYAIHAAYRRDYIPLAEAFGQYVGRDLDARSRLAAVWVILCSEPWAQSRGDAAAGGYLGAAAAARARLFARACSVVPREVALPGPVARRFPNTPVLLLAGGQDPLDPPANLAGWRRVYPDGRLVVVPDGAHGEIEFPCVQSLVAQFVALARARGLDAGCARRVTPPPFETG
jgi:pimeloyl-ACP methyl ester carboxylesterase